MPRTARNAVAAGVRPKRLQMTYATRPRRPGRASSLSAAPGPLQIPGRPGRRVVDSPEYMPQEWRAVAVASAAQLDACRAHAADRVYLSPPAVLEPGRRTGTYRRGTITLITSADGTSRISAEDLALAVVDELESPREDRHFTVGY